MNSSCIAGVNGFRAQDRIIETRHYISRSFKEVLNLTPRRLHKRPTLPGIALYAVLFYTAYNKKGR